MPLQIDLDIAAFKLTDKTADTWTRAIGDLKQQSKLQNQGKGQVNSLLIILGWIVKDSNVSFFGAEQLLGPL